MSAAFFAFMAMFGARSDAAACNWKSVLNDEAMVAKYDHGFDLNHAEAELHASSTRKEYLSAVSRATNYSLAQLYFGSLSYDLEQCADAAPSEHGFPSWKLRLAAVDAMAQHLALTDGSDWNLDQSSRIYGLLARVAGDSAAPVAAKTKARDVALTLCTETEVNIPADSRPRLCGEAFDDRVASERRATHVVHYERHDASTACSVPNRDASVRDYVQPDYPDDEQRDVPVAVVVKVHVDSDGSVGGAKVVHPSHIAPMDSAALTAALTSTYQPAERNCKPAPQDLLFTVNFDPNS